MSFLDEPDQTPDVREDQLTRLFEEFLDSETDFYNYQDDIATMLRENRRRLVVNIDHLRAYKPELAEDLLNQPVDYFPAFESALVEVIARAQNKDKQHLEQEGYHVGLSGSFGDHHVSPRTLRAAQLGRMISLEGIVTRCSLVRPKLVKSVHYCPKNRFFFAHDYRDALNATPNKPQTSSVTPVKDDEGNLLVTEFGHCVFRDHQRISIQEMPERSPAGQLPRSTDVILDDDLVDKCKPGDRIQLVGSYRSVGGGANGAFKSLIVANNINLLSTKTGGGIVEAPLTPDDIRMIHSLANKQKEKIFDLLAQSLAPSIYGHEHIKQAVVLLLLGGVEKNLPNGTHIRGDINVLMVGDPSTAKSQMLRFVLGTAPLAIATTGRGSSGVGLTAAVTTDKDTGERRLEAGAMVLADRGVVCIDEFDKMSDIDRVAIHEVMEQQTVTIAKAGIHTTLNARCSVIAAANPIYGQYDVHKDPHKNIALPDSLLSRFDLLFVVTDDVDETRDRQIADHVLRMHRYLPPGVEEGTPVADSLTQQLSIDGPGVANDTVEEGEAPTPFEKFDPLIHFGVGVGVEGRYDTRSGRNKDKQPQVLSIAFVKKYIQYAKRREPALTQAASDYIVSVYSELRNEHLEGNQKRTSPLTARTLETLIRLATAHAKARLSLKVEEEDAIEAEDILRFALYKEVVKRRHKKKRTKSPRPGAADESGDEGSDDDDDSGDEAEPKRMEDPPQSKGKEKEKEVADPVWGEGTQDVEMAVDPLPAPVAPTPPQANGIRPERYNLFRSTLSRLTSGAWDGEEVWPLQVIIHGVNQGLGAGEHFGPEESTAILQKMTDDNEVMLSGDVVYKIS